MPTLQLGGVSHHADRHRNVHLTPTVLVGGRFCNWYDRQGEPPPITIRDIARLIYPTQCSKNHSGVLILQF